MVALTPEAQGQLMGPIAHYENLNRPAVTRNLMAAVEAAKELIYNEGAGGGTARASALSRIEKARPPLVEGGPLLDFVQRDNTPGDNGGIF